MERFLDVRKLAALDMALHGARFVVFEFLIGVVACAALGVVALVVGLREISHGFSWRVVLGVALIGAAANYLPLLLHAVDLARKGTATEEAAELAKPGVIRRYSVRQGLLLVPFAVALMGARQAMER